MRERKFPQNVKNPCIYTLYLYSLFCFEGVVVTNVCIVNSV